MTDRVLRFKYRRKGGWDYPHRLPNAYMPPGDYEVEVVVTITRLPEKRRRPVSRATKP